MYICNIGIICRYVIRGHGGNDGTAEKPLIAPMFVARGPNDEVFVRDDYTQRLVVYTPTANKLEYSHYLGDKDMFANITGIAVGKECLYVADSGLHRILKLELKNGRNKLQIDGYGTDHDFNSPHGLELDEGKSVLYVCDSGNDRIQIIHFSSDGLKFTSFGKHGTSEGDFNYPMDITLNHAKDHLYITDRDNDRVQIFDTSGNHAKVFDIKCRIYDPFGICTFLRGKYCLFGFCLRHPEVIVLSCKTLNVVYMVDTDGNLISTLNHDSYEFNSPCGVVVMNNEQIVVASIRGNILTVI